jgi:hypothetical protein
MDGHQLSTIEIHTGVSQQQNRRADESSFIARRSHIPVASTEYSKGFVLRGVKVSSPDRS